MEDSLGSTIEKIKVQEQNKEAKLKEKREIDAVVMSLRKEIRQSISEVEISKQKQKNTSKNLDTLRTQVILQKIRRGSLTTQLHMINMELDNLRAKSSEDMSKVWEQRSSFSNTIHNISDKCDIWALLIKPTCKDLSFMTQSIVKQENTNPVLNNEIRLKAAVTKRNNAIVERDRLKAEPDNGEEFLRIRNALRYSLEKIEELKK